MIRRPRTAPESQPSSLLEPPPGSEIAVPYRLLEEGKEAYRAGFMDGYKAGFRDAVLRARRTRKTPGPRKRARKPR